MTQLREQEQRLVSLYPAIEWDAPLRASVPDRGVTRLTCRFCIALNGLKASELEQVGFATEEEFREHFDDEHHVREGQPA